MAAYAHPAPCSPPTSDLAPLRKGQIRAGVALARALLDEVDRLVPDGAAGTMIGVELEDQLSEELARLARRLLEAAESLAAPTDGPVR